MLTKVSVAVILLVAISIGSARRAIDVREIPTPRRVYGPMDCKAKGLMCRTCDTIQSCVSNDPANPKDFTETIVGKCNSTSYCLNGSCIPDTEPNPFCQKSYDTFDCPSYGMYPDPAFCQKFHICTPSDTTGTGTGSNGDPQTRIETPAPPKDASVSCGDDYAYNARTTYCDKKLTNNQCVGWPVPLCKTAGQNGPLVENPSIYYQCVEFTDGTNILLKPVVNVCKNGRQYKTGWGCQ